MKEEVTSSDGLQRQKLVLMIVAVARIIHAKEN